MSMLCESIGNLLLFYDFCVVGLFLICLIGVRVPVLPCNRVAISGGGSICYVLGGRLCFVQVGAFDINLCGKNGGDYVMVIFTLVVLIWELLYVASRLYHLREIFVCVNSDWCVCLVQTFGCNPRSRNLFE